MSFDNILLDTPEAGIYLLTVNRPKQLNALNQQTLEEIRAAAQQLAMQQDIRVLIVTGSGDKSFIAGADIKQMWEKTAVEGQRFSSLGLSTVQALSDLPFPVIAAVNGYALGGGCELALACDWIIAAENAQFGQPEVKLGVPPGFGGTQRLPRRIGSARAMEMIVSGRSISAQTALDWGLVNHVYPSDQLMDEALKIARTICAQAPIAVELSKKLVRDGEDMPLDRANSMENRAFGIAFSTADQTEGMKAFVEKRKAVFTAQ
ncbi:MAG: enoyl-CoA hydratase/isomerase family protein [Thiolinea sp.]